MRLLFVSHVHPDTGLVGAVRLNRFAQELAQRGHKVILLCGMDATKADTPATFAQRVADQDWSEPLVLAVADASPIRPASKATGVRRVLSRAQTATTLLAHGGSFWRWQRAARAFHQPIKTLFAPELAYGTFVNLDALAITRDYARRFGIPWVMDIKDPASNFIPRPLQRWLMPRYRDAVAVTLNSEFQRSHNSGWVDESSTVIYSGVESAPVGSYAFDSTQVALVGSIYTDAAAAVLLRGFARWRSQVQPNATLHYFGVDGARVALVAKAAQAEEGLIVEGQVPRNDLLERCARMAALMYASHPENTFHHKLLELAAIGRPLVTSPTEGAEAQALCERFHIAHTDAATAEAVSGALTTAAATPTADMAVLCREMSWARAAEQLEDLFVSALFTHPVVGSRVTATQPSLRIAIASSGRFHVLDLARELAALGHDVRFYSYVPKRRAVKFGLPPRCHVGLLPALAPFLVLIRMFRRGRIASWLNAALHRTMDALVARRLAPCDVFIGMSGMYVKAPLKARKAFGAKIVIERGSVHIVLQKQILDNVKSHNPRTGSVPAQDVARELEAYQLADKIVIPSLHAERSFIERGVPLEKLFRNPYGVDLAMFRPQPGIQRDPHLVLYVGSWAYQKGVDVLVEAMRTLAGDGFRLCHVGATGDAPMPLAPWFQSIGRMDQPRLAEWYSRAGCLALPSRQEGLSLVQAQALACGCPVIGTTMTGAADLDQMFPASGMVQILPVDNPAALARAIRCATAPPSQVGGTATDTLRERLSWRAYARRYDDTLRVIVQHGVCRASPRSMQPD